MKSNDLQRYHVPNLERATGIAELLADHPDGLNMIEIAGRMDIPNNSVYRITSTLVSHSSKRLCCRFVKTATRWIGERNWRVYTALARPS